ncbi:MAG: ribosome-associated translation inhibitor RaiA [Chloroflexi bacterium]|nr:ribosome-associated translation inhibitor RaiA [Chloroflexota bacterium]
MELNITAKNIALSDALKRYLDKKFGKLDQRLPRVLEAKVVITSQRAKNPMHRYIAEITINSNGTLLRAQERASALYAAIDMAADVMDRQIERFKSRLLRKPHRFIHRPGAAPPTEAEIEAAQEETEEAPSSKVVRVKRFPVKPMSPEEAADQMELLGHDFFLFYNGDTKTFNLIYRRKTGDYGLIEPLLG